MHVVFVILFESLFHSHFFLFCEVVFVQKMSIPRLAGIIQSSCCVVVVVAM